MLRTPGGGAGDGAAAADGRLLSIGSVLNVLREEFPEVTLSKIRFLEAEGLVEPQRTPSGYRKFTPGDVERLARVLRMQRDQYLPLKVIREQLDAGPAGEAPAAAQESAEEAEPEAPGDGERPAVRVGRAELLAAAQVDEDTLAEWESYGLLGALPGGGYEAEALTVATLVRELGRFGIEPRHLRVLKASAEREAGLVDQVVAPLRLHRNPQTRAHAQARTKELAGLTARLHSVLLQSALGVRLP
ncbi:transcriptional regulator FtsR [Streptomyces physcomitrii]|uniref:MerR family transcriptional regulator n=1 Tax=Streptomyces physcomitrii TaxID=2724184 RepID=A0ABX1H997_9ACTN|nr:MerR family transcriptional regulator [Streptomyces physcomitrii]NKI44979.1 MerR family transcriptional regulator [Streptomyces physcomitrii]